jgi:hypothetical protein
MTSENQKRDPRKGPWPLVLVIALTAFAIAIGILLVTTKMGIFDGKGF